MRLRQEISNMKKTILVLTTLCAGAIITLSACGSGNDNDTTSDTMTTVSPDTSMNAAPMDTSTMMTDTTMKDSLNK